MQEQIKDLIQAISNGNASETQDRLNSIMAQKSIAALDTMRIDVAKNMFNPSSDTQENQ